MKTPYHITIQFATNRADAPSASKLKRWAMGALQHEASASDITLRIIDEEESQILNRTYRHQDKPTNVLSFEDDTGPGTTLLGDIAICANIVNKEAREQNKPCDAHWAHMVIHGILHLAGYDHEVPTDADAMETLEINILAALGFDNPYEDDNH